MDNRFNQLCLLRMDSYFGYFGVGFVDFSFLFGFGYHSLQISRTDLTIAVVVKTFYHDLFALFVQLVVAQLFDHLAQFFDAEPFTFEKDLFDLLL